MPAHNKHYTCSLNGGIYFTPLSLASVDCEQYRHCSPQVESTSCEGVLSFSLPGTHSFCYCTIIYISVDDRNVSILHVPAGSFFGDAFCQEDAYLRDNYPLYADTSSAFEVLGAADEMEAKHRTHDQIKARVKKLGLTAASHASTRVDSESAPDTDEEPGGSDADVADNKGESEEAEMADKTGGSDEESAAGDTGPASPVHVRKIESKNHGQSDDDDEGLFSSNEVSIIYPHGALLLCV